MVAPSRNYQYNKKYKDIYNAKIYYCTCGSEVKNASSYSHLKSKKHLKFESSFEYEKEFNLLNRISLEVFHKKILF